MQHIAVDDIGAFAALAFGNPDDFLGKELEIAGDTLSMAQVAAAIGAAIGRPLRYAQFPDEALRQSPVLGAIRDFAEAKGFAADIPALRLMHPELLTFDRWLKAKGEALFEARLANAPGP